MTRWSEYHRVYQVRDGLWNQASRRVDARKSKEPPSSPNVTQFQCVSFTRVCCGFRTHARSPLRLLNSHASTLLTVKLVRKKKLAVHICVGRLSEGFNHSRCIKAAQLLLLPHLTSHPHPSSTHPPLTQANPQHAGTLDCHWYGYQGGHRPSSSYRQLQSRSGVSSLSGDEEGPRGVRGLRRHGNVLYGTLSP